MQMDSQNYTSRSNMPSGVNQNLGSSPAIQASVSISTGNKWDFFVLKMFKNLIY